MAVCLSSIEDNIDDDDNDYTTPINILPISKRQFHMLG